MWEETERIFLDSLARALHGIARVAPGLLAMMLILGAAIALALVLRVLVRRSLERIGLDRRLREWGVAPPAAEGRAGPSRLVARFVTWTVLAVGFVAGLSAIDAAMTSALALRLLDYAPHVLVAAVILVVGYAGSRAVERAVLLAAVNAGLPSARLAGLAARWLMVILAAAIALENLGIGGHVVPLAFGILFGGIVLAGALAVGLGARHLVARSLERHFPAGPRAIEEPPDEGRIHHL
jgi:mechanosensitive ion channel-like protein